MARPVPRLKRHPNGQAYVSFKLYGRRRWIYLGPFATRTAEARYKAFCRTWPAVLFEPWPEPGEWPEQRMLTLDGRTRNLQAWAKEYGLKPRTLAHRLDVQGLPLEEALTRPVKPWVHRKRKEATARGN